MEIIQSHPNATSINITKISIPSVGNSYNIIPMSTSNNINYYYNFCNTSYIGKYVVTTCGNGDGIITCMDYGFWVKPNGEDFTSVEISIYIFFLLLCLLIIFFSVRLINNNTVEKDQVEEYKLYEIRKRNEFTYLLKVLKKKTWIIGVFGIYLSLLLFFTILNQLVFNLGLDDLNEIIKYIVLLLSWGLIPFVLFWIVYTIIFVYTTTKNVLKYQFGGFRR